MKLALQQTASYLPQLRVPADVVMQDLGVEPNERRIVTRFHQVGQVSLCRPEETLKSLLWKAIQPLRPLPQDLDGVLFAHSLLPQPGAQRQLMGEILEALELGHVPYLGFSHLNCVSFISALDFMLGIQERTETPCRFLLLTGEFTSFMPQARYLGCSTVMSDGATASLFRGGEGPLRVLDTEIQQDFSFSEGYYEKRDSRAQYSRVFLDRLIGTLTHLLQRNGLRLEDVAAVVPQNINNTLWKRFAETTRYPRDKILDLNFSTYSHSYSNDVFLNVQTALEDQKLPTGPLLILGLGLGAYFGASLWWHGERGES